MVPSFIHTRVPWRRKVSMKAISTLCSAALLGLMLAGCNPPPPPAAPDTHDADVRAITELETQWNQAYVAKDVDKIAAYYADDAVLMGPGSPAAKGKSAIVAELKQMVADPAFSLRFMSSTVDVAKSGDLGYTQGDFQTSMTNPKTHKAVDGQGSYVTVYRKQPDGSWKVVSDIATFSGEPMPAPKAKKK
jgi:uncharacterized protein (TIGR02246 family)